MVFCCFFFFFAVLVRTVHCGSLRQTAQIVHMSQECLRTGDKALVLFRFIKHPEYIKANQRLVFREGRTKVGPESLKKTDCLLRRFCTVG